MGVSKTGADYNRLGKVSSGQSDVRAVKRVAGKQYGEDLGAEKASADARPYMTDTKVAVKSYGAPATGEQGGGPVQGPLEAIGGGSADEPNFPLY